MMRRQVIVILCFVSLVFGISGCGNSSGGQSGPAQFKSGGTFTMAVQTDPHSADMYRSASAVILPYNFAYDSLVQQKDDGSFVSGLADKWNVGENTSTFTLKSGITCSDGTPLTASQVVADFNFIANPKNGSTLYSLYVPTVPFTATADDATRTVTVKTKVAFGYIPNTLGTLPIMCEKGLKDPHAVETASDGTGPYVLTSVKSGVSYTYSVRKDYTWGPGGQGTGALGQPATIVVKIVPSQDTAANLAVTRELNYVFFTSAANQKRIVAAGGTAVDHYLPSAWLWFNQLKKDLPTADLRVRQALMAALDLKQLIKVSTSGTGKAATTIEAPPICPGDVVTGNVPDHDVAEAARLLDEAGWTKGSGGVRAKGGKTLSIDLHYVPAASANSGPAAELVAQQWEAIGVKVKLTNDSYEQFTTNVMGTGNYDVLLQRFALTLPTQFIPYLDGPNVPNGTNFTGTHNPVFHEASTKAMGLKAPDACPFWNKAESAVVKDLNVVPISDDNEPYLLMGAQAKFSVWLHLPIPTTIRMLK